jgi:hypothetical protein
VRRVIRPRPDDRAEEVERLLRTVQRWALSRDDIDAVALVGSWTRGDAFAHSDVDLVFVTRDVSTYVEGTSWVEVFAGAAIVGTQSWGAVTERRLVLPSALKSRWASRHPPGLQQTLWIPEQRYS